MSLQIEAENLAQELFEARSTLRMAGRTLHDQIGPLLSAAGIHLDLLRADHPQTDPAVRQTLAVLEEAMNNVRALSRVLNPTPSVHLGLKKAFASLVESQRENFCGAIRFSYTASAAPPDGVAAAMYEAAAAILADGAADPSASRLSVSVRGTRSVIVTIGSNGRGSNRRVSKRRELPDRAPRPAAVIAAQALRARPAGIILDTSTKRGTIVSIRYVPRRSARGRS